MTYFCCSRLEGGGYGKNDFPVCKKVNEQKRKDKAMKKFLVLIFLLFLVVGFSAQAAVMTGGVDKWFYTNYETIFRDYGDGNGYVEIDQTQGIVNVAVGDIFVGIINVQEITGPNNEPLWDNPGGDQLTGIFAQEVTNIYLNPGVDANLDLSPASVNTFTTLAGDTFNTGLAQNEMFEIFLDAGGSTNFNTGGTIAQNIADATDGVSFLVLGDADSPSVPYTTFNETDDGTAPTGAVFGTSPPIIPLVPGTGTEVAGEEYAWSNTTPFGTAGIDFSGEAIVGLSVLYAAFNTLGFNSLNDPLETRFDSDVQFYANSELTINPDWEWLRDGDGNLIATGTSPWYIESNDPGRLHGVIPEPSTILLMGFGLLGASAILRRRTKS